MIVILLCPGPAPLSFFFFWRLGESFLGRALVAIPRWSRADGQGRSCGSRAYSAGTAHSCKTWNNFQHLAGWQTGFTVHMSKKTTLNLEGRIPSRGRAAIACVPTYWNSGKRRTRNGLWLMIVLSDGLQRLRLLMEWPNTNVCQECCCWGHFCKIFGGWGWPTAKTQREGKTGALCLLGS